MASVIDPPMPVCPVVEKAHRLACAQVIPPRASPAWTKAYLAISRAEGEKSDEVQSTTTIPQILHQWIILFWTAPFKQVASPKASVLLSPNNAALRAILTILNARNPICPVSPTLLELRLRVESFGNCRLPSQMKSHPQDMQVRRETALGPRAFLKWPGGKRWLVQQHSHLLPKAFHTYIEPFLGAGSVFFYLCPERAILGDKNAALINLYQSLKDDWRTVYEDLERHQTQHYKSPEQHYYQVRMDVPLDSVRQASRLLYLNRTCFNGIYRVNKKGEFNVPKGSKDTVVFEGESFEQLSRMLQKAELVAGDFEPLIKRAKSGDFVFCDPPYTVRHNCNGFRKYNEVLFSWSDQERLARELEQAAVRGVKIVCTNANHPSIRELYRSSCFHQMPVTRFSSISADGASRRVFEELIVRANFC